MAYLCVLASLVASPTALTQAEPNPNHDSPPKPPVTRLESISDLGIPVRIRPVQPNDTVQMETQAEPVRATQFGLAFEWIAPKSLGFDIESEWTAAEWRLKLDITLDVVQNAGNEALVTHRRYVWLGPELQPGVYDVLARSRSRQRSGNSGNPGNPGNSGSDAGVSAYLPLGAAQFRVTQPPSGTPGRRAEIASHTAGLDDDTISVITVRRGTTEELGLELRLKSRTPGQASVRVDAEARTLWVTVEFPAVEAVAPAGAGAGVTRYWLPLYRETTGAGAPAASGLDVGTYRIVLTREVRREVFEPREFDATPTPGPNPPPKVHHTELLSELLGAAVLRVYAP